MRDTAIVNCHIKSAETQAFCFDAGGVVGQLVSPELVPTKINAQDLRNSSSMVRSIHSRRTAANTVLSRTPSGNSALRYRNKSHGLGKRLRIP